MLKNTVALNEVSTAELDRIEGGQPTTGEIVKGAVAVGWGCLVFGPIGGAAALAGVLLAGYSTKAYQGMGDAYLLPSIAAVVIGGVSLFGGRGSVSDAVVGTLVMGVLFNGLVLLNVPSPIQNVIIGAILIGAVTLDGLFRRRGE